MFEFGLLLVFGFAFTVFVLFERDMRGYTSRDRRLILEFLQARQSLLG